MSSTTRRTTPLLDYSLIVVFSGFLGVFSRFSVWGYAATLAAWSPPGLFGCHIDRISICPVGDARALSV